MEYAGAICHVMARGDRREDIVRDDRDRERFEETLAEVVGRSGWVLYAWVLMSNHYHFLLKTPEPNLVAGMTWFKGLVAGIIRGRFMVDNGRLAERLHMGARNAVSRTIRLADNHLKADRAARRMAKEHGRNVK